jgi:cobalt-zinc-cadmium efflux system membrane fusion protein
LIRRAESPGFFLGFLDRRAHRARRIPHCGAADFFCSGLRGWGIVWGMSLIAKAHFPRLLAALSGVSLLTSAVVTSPAMAEGPMKGADFIRVVPDQMHQLQVVKVETTAFRTQRSAIGQIGYNEEASTIVLTPFSGRVIRLIAKLGEQVKKGDPLLEIDSPEQLVPQNDFIAALAAKRKAGSQHNLAVIAEKRVRNLHEGKAAPSKDLQAAEAQLASAEHDLRSADTAFEAARIRLRILGRTEEEISNLEQNATLTRVTTITAPIGGTVVARKVGPGQYVKAD